MKILKIFAILLLAILVLAAALVAYLSITEYDPEPVEQLEISHNEVGVSFEGDTLRLLCFNIGYGGLGADADFFMDGGKAVRGTDKAQVHENLLQILFQLRESEADILLLQEVDTGSTRSYGFDQAALFGEQPSAYAYNYHCDWVPYPMPMIGRVRSGLQTLSRYTLSSAERIALPCPFSWPVSAANLKRCLLVSRIDLADGRQLVVFNVHMEAYDDGEGKLAQTEQLWQLLEEEYAKGNYVIAGGDFNQVFPGTLETYPIQDPELWSPGVLYEEDLPEGWQYVYDPETPTCRLLNQPYDPASPATQHYIIDGFILSPNLMPNAVRTIPLSFAWSDHNPVRLDVTLR